VNSCCNITERLGIDKAAAERFIKHAIAQSKYGRPPGDNAEATPSDVRVPIRVTSKMLERAQYDKELNEMGSEEEEDLKTFDEVPDGDQNVGESNDEAGIAEALRPSKWKGKQKADDAVSDDLPAGAKRRRPRVDPFAGESFCRFSMFLEPERLFLGYGDDKDPSALLSNEAKKHKPMMLAVQDVSMAGSSQNDSNAKLSTMASSKAKASRQAKKEEKATRKAKKARPLTG